jgi:hypothetical protein
VDAAVIQFQQFDLLLLLATAQDDAKRRRLAGLLLVFGQPAQAEEIWHVGVFEIAQLELDGHQPFQAAVVEQQVDIEIVVVDLDAFLASDEGESRRPVPAGSFPARAGWRLPGLFPGSSSAGV